MYKRQVLDLAKDGWDLVIDGRDEQSLRSVAKEVDALGARAVSVPGDVTDPAHREQLVHSAEAVSYTHLDVYKRQG